MVSSELVLLTLVGRTFRLCRPSTCALIIADSFLLVKGFSEFFLPFSFLLSPGSPSGLSRPDSRALGLDPSPFHRGTAARHSSVAAPRRFVYRPSEPSRPARVVTRSRWNHPLSMVLLYHPYTANTIDNLGKFSTTSDIRQAGMNDSGFGSQSSQNHHPKSIIIKDGIQPQSHVFTVQNPMKKKKQNIMKPKPATAFSIISLLTFLLYYIFDYMSTLKFYMLWVPARGHQMMPFSIACFCTKYRCNLISAISVLYR